MPRGADAPGRDRRQAGCMSSQSRAPAGPFQRRIPAWIGDLVAAVFVLGPALAIYPGSAAQTGNLVGVIAGVAGALAMPLRRRWPIPVLAACIALFGVAAFGHDRAGAGARERDRDVRGRLPE
jgi:hypothetical protein